MNPLTQVKRTQKINSTEAALGISDEASWHAKYKDSAYVFVGGIPFDLTEGDLLAVFAQYGEIVDVNLVRDKGTGKSKGFAFLAYEDQRSTILAVDNLNGAKILGRIVRVDHVTKYKKKEEEDEEEEKRKREARGICYAFQRGECNRGAACKFSHDEQRNANTGWGAKDSSSSWEHDRYSGPPKSHKNYSKNAAGENLEKGIKDGDTQPKPTDKRERMSRLEDKDYKYSYRNYCETSLKDQEKRGAKVSGKQTNESRDTQIRGNYSGRSKSEVDQDEPERQGKEKRGRHDGETSSDYHKDADKQHRKRGHR